MKKMFLIIMILLCYYSNKAQDTIPKKQVEEVTIRAFRFPENIKKIPFSTSKILNKGWNMNTPTTADVLQNSGTVLVQKSQAGGGSPIIRGFEASRILLMVDGIRMNNAIYRAGHLQNIITVDANILNAIEIIYGPSSTQYGSDALGGAINMLTKNPILSSVKKTILSGNIGSRYSSALNELQTHADINIGSKKWASLTSFTFSNFGDVVQGDNRKNKYPDFGKKPFYINTISGNDYVVPNQNTNKQIASAYQQVDFVQKIKYVPKEGREHIVNIQYSNTNNVPRYDRLTEVASNLPRFAEWYYGPQKRFMVAYHFNAEYQKGFIQKIQSTLSYQQIEESRFDRRFNNRNRNSRIENLDILGYTLDLLNKQGKSETHFGIDAQINKLNSIAFTENIVTGEKQNNITTRYPDGNNRMSTVAFYLQYLYEINKKTNLNAGFRFTQTDLRATFINKNVLNFPFDNASQQHGALSGNIGITHNTTNNWKLAAIISTGFRAPNFDELKVFDSRPGFLIVPNTNIKPEYTYNAEINANKYLGDFKFGAALFYTLFKNAIQIDTFTFNNASTINFQGVNSQVQAAQNKGRAYLYGFSANSSYTFKQKTTIEGAITYTYGRVTKPNEVPLDHIPPVYGRFSIKHIEKKWNAEIFSLFNGWKKLKDYSPSGEDNLQYATPDGMPSWYTINLRTAYSLQNNLNLLLGVENILDTNYRVFASGISSSGRNYIVSLRASF